VAKNRNTSKASGTKSAIKTSPTPDPVSATAVLEAPPTPIETRPARPRVYMTDISIILLDPPDVLARPIDDGEYMADLLDSMRSELGQIDPIIVTPNGVRFKIVDGMHRFTAARTMGWKTLRAQVFTDEKVAIEAIQLHTCMVHKEMTAWEEYLFYYNLTERLNMGFEDVCVYTHRSEAYVSTRLCIGNLTDETKTALQNGRINLSVAVQLMRVKEPLWERYFLDQCLINGCGARVLVGWISKWQLEKVPLTEAQIVAATTPPPPPPPAVEIPCGLCGQVSGGRQMVQVLVHYDELQSLAHFIQVQDRVGVASGAPAQPPGEAVK
jgi:ParB/RepB/Spo0J family partition protein